MNNDDNTPEFPSIDEISVELPAVSEFCPASRLPELFKSTDSDTLPVADMRGRLVGIISEYDLAKILPKWAMEGEKEEHNRIFEQDSYLHEYQVSSLMTKDVWIETADTNISGLLSKVNKMHTRVIPVVEKDGTYSGTVITRSAIIDYLTRFVKPRSLGGLATPLGVYITDGKHQAGTGNSGLFLTGIVLGMVIYFIETLTLIVTKIYNINIANEQVMPMIIVAQIVMFLAILRLTPLVKIHAAEHQTINAIERGIPLTVETVRMQPKEHVRCGTNLMVLLIGIQLVLLTYAGYLQKTAPLLQFLYLIIGFSFVFSNWKKGGILLQKYFTTVKAPDKYILSGIKAGKEILEKYKHDTDPKPPSLVQKLWLTGLAQIISGFIVVHYVFDSLSHLISTIL